MAQEAASKDTTGICEEKESNYYMKYGSGK